MTEPVLQVRDLKKHFAVRSGILQRAGGTVFAVDSQHITWRTPDSEGAE